MSPQMSLDSRGNPISHVRHVSVSHVRHVIDSHVRPVSVSHVRHVRGRFPAANVIDLSPLSLQRIERNFLL